MTQGYAEKYKEESTHLNGVPERRARLGDGANLLVMDLCGDYLTARFPPGQAVISVNQQK